MKDHLTRFFAAKRVIIARFLSACDGNFAVIFTLVLLPLIASAGVAVDYSRAVNVHSYAQQQADATSLGVARFGPDRVLHADLAILKAAVEQRWNVNNVEVSASWPTPAILKVEVKGQVPLTLLTAVPGFPEMVPIHVVSKVQVAEPRYIYKEPEVSELDYEAGDYNRIYVYCFNPEKKNDPETRGRTQMTAIADNYDSSVYKYEMPRCDSGESLSYKLLNVRLVRAEPHRWNTANPRFEFYTDTVLEPDGVEKHTISCTGHDACNYPPLAGWSIMESVLCDTKEQCIPKSQGGIIPEGKDRTPVQMTSSCTPGKFMYYGWEDRPPGLPGSSADWSHIAWTDRDYDDIRIVIGCPELEKVGDLRVWLAG